LPCLLFAVTAVLGLSGCLLFTDPINRAPSVTIVAPSGSVYRGQPAGFWVTVSDDHDSLSTLQIRWAELPSQSQDCNWVTGSNWTNLAPDSTPSSADAPYEFVAKNLSPICLCAQAADRDHASTVACHLVNPVNPPPTITDLSGKRSGEWRDLCADVHLSAEDASYGTTNTLVFDWKMVYSGDFPSDAKSSSVSAPTWRPRKKTCIAASTPTRRAPTPSA
jgi:hypothetical protein